MTENAERGAPYEYAYDRVSAHFPDLRVSDLTAVERVFPVTVRADLEAAVDAVLAQCAEAIDFVGISTTDRYQILSFTTIVSERNRPPIIGATQYLDIDVGGESPARCVESGLYTFKMGGGPAALLISQQPHFVTGEPGVRVEAITSPAAGGHAQAQKLFAALVEALAADSVYRGRTLSFEMGNRYDGGLGALKVHNLPSTSQEDVVLPDALLATLERTVFGFTTARRQLRDMGFSAKRGILLYGPPGTGKTHFIRHMLSRLDGHTALLVTAEQVGAIDEIMMIARALEPSVVVIEDADLIARSRERMNDPCSEVLLNKLLNHMDGLSNDAEIMFILTTNRPEELEDAIRNRPGRIDQAIEIPKPDAACRRRLLDLYRLDFELDEELMDACVERSEGATASFMRELARRMAQYAILRGDEREIRSADMRLAFEELFTGGDLTGAALGCA